MIRRKCGPLMSHWWAMKSPPSPGCASMYARTFNAVGSSGGSDDAAGSGGAGTSPARSHVGRVFQRAVLNSANVAEILIAPPMPRPVFTRHPCEVFAVIGRLSTQEDRQDGLLRPLWPSPAVLVPLHHRHV